MKKTLFYAVFAILGFTIYTPAKAALMGFLDGNIFDTTVSITEPQYICFMNSECLKKDGTVTTRQALGLGSLPQTSGQSPVPQSTPETVYVPVYVPQPAGTVETPSSNQTTTPVTTPLVFHCQTTYFNVGGTYTCSSNKENTEGYNTLTFDALVSLKPGILPNPYVLVNGIQNNNFIQANIDIAPVNNLNQKVVVTTDKLSGEVRLPMIPNYTGITDAQIILRNFKFINTITNQVIPVNN